MIPLRELWEGFNPAGFSNGKFVLFRGYIDESYGGAEDVFALSCLIAKGKDWNDMMRAWKLHLHAVNKKLKKQSRPLISRYHASDCSSRHGEFEGWSVQEQIDFSLGLFGIFKRVPVHAVGYVVDLGELSEVFPDDNNDRLKTAYSIMTKFVMFTIGQDFHDLNQGRLPSLTLFHDYTAGGKYDPTILESFNKLKFDPSFPYASYFTTIAPLSWKDCIALQPADLVAYEVFKEAERQVQARKRRKSFEALLNLDTFGIHVKNFTKQKLEELREVLRKQLNQVT